MQRAAVAARGGFAEVCSDSDELGMIVVPEFDAFGDIGLAEMAKRFVVDGFFYELMTQKNAFGVGIDNKYRFVGSIEDYAVGSFRPDTVY